LGELAAVPGINQEGTVTVDEFLVIRHWLIDRWPSMSSLTSGQWVAYRDELACFNPAEVQAALDVYAVSEPQFPPGVMTLKKLATEIALQNTQRRALPPAQVDAAESLRVFQEQHDGLLPSQVHYQTDVKGTA
jgi:hypothetical protein